MGCIENDRISRDNELEQAKIAFNATLENSFEVPPKGFT